MGKPSGRGQVEARNHFWGLESMSPTTIFGDTPGRVANKFDLRFSRVVSWTPLDFLLGTVGNPEHK
jgi:hypothetical protein